MSDQVVRLNVDDFDDTMAMMARAFAEWGTHDFPRMYPALYRPTAEVMSRHLAVRRDGRVAAAVGIMPITMHVDGVDLSVAGIAGVATDPPYRGQGMMRHIMEAAVDAVRHEDFAISYLGGHRQRYGRFGWEVAGTDMKMQFDVKNMASVEAEGVQIEPLPEAGQVLDAARRLHAEKSVHCRRCTVDFHPMLCNWEQVPYVATDASGRVIGYLSADTAGSTVNELVGVDMQSTVRVLATWVRRQAGRVTLWVDCYASLLARRLGELAQVATLSASGNWQIFDWLRTVGAFWRLRCREVELPWGSVVLGIHGRRRNLKLSLSDGVATCAETDDPADVTADAATMTRLLFGPAGPEQVMPLPARAAVLHAWCPMPLALPGPDRV